MYKSNSFRKTTSSNPKIDVKDANGNTALMSSAIKGDKKKADALIAACCNLNVQNNDDDTALTLAAWKNHENIARALISAGCNLNLQNTAGDTALTLAAWNNNKNLTRELIAAHCILDLQDKNGETALAVAIKHNHEDVAYELIIAKAQVNIPNNQRKMALDYALQNKNLHIISLLLTYGAYPKNPQALLDYLNTCDQRNPDLLISLKSLCEQQQSIHDRKIAGAAKLDKKVFQQTKIYLDKLANLNKSYARRFKKLLNATPLPASLVEVISQLDNEPIGGNRIRFFASSEILKPEEVDQIASPQDNAHCLFM